jgi:hypothetical protein
VRHYDVLPGMSLSDEVVVRDLEESAHRGGFVVVACRPGTHGCPRGIGATQGAMPLGNTPL